MLTFRPRPYAIAATSALCSAWLADRWSWRMPIIVGGQVLVIIANSIQFVYAADIANNVALCYFCTFMALAGAYPIIPGKQSRRYSSYSSVPFDC